MTSGNVTGYVILGRDRDRLDRGLPPLNDEYYGPMWAINRVGDDPSAVPAVIVPDPGDGSAADLARAILEFLRTRA